MTSKVSIISDAFVLLGKQAINHLDTTNPIHVASSNIYDLILPDLLCKAPWRSAMKNQTLGQLTTEPNNDEAWTYIYELPDDPPILLLYKTYPETNYQIYENHLYCNVNEIKIDYVFKPQEDRFPPYFVSLMVYAMAYHLSMAVTQNSGLVSFWYKQFIQQQVIATGISANQVPSQIIGNDVVYGAHFV